MTLTRSVKQEVRRAAREHLGYDELRPGQEEVARTVLAGHDTLAVLPTGAGKSAIYQVAAVLTDGPTIVVSPLIALQRDQVQSLEGLRAGAGAVLNSEMTSTERESVLQELESGQLEYMFLAPEQLTNEETLE